jgi:DNA topoisomerase-1
LTQLEEGCAKADKIFLAPDPDREGEAIAVSSGDAAWDECLQRKKIQRVTFNEITKKAVQDAFQHARDIDQDLVDAQQTRRVLDRLVGYQVSPLLWDKVRRGTFRGTCADGCGAADCGAGAGDWRVQAGGVLDAGGAALSAGPEGQDVYGTVYRRGWRAGAGSNGVDKEGKAQFIGSALPDEKSMNAVVSALDKARWTLASVQSKEQQRRPLSPFITSQLQRDASTKLGFNVRRTMGVAQRLYEGVEVGAEGTVGLITYMRTDSPRARRSRLRRRGNGSRARWGRSICRQRECLQGQEGCAGCA